MWESQVPNSYIFLYLGSNGAEYRGPSYRYLAGFLQDMLTLSSIYVADANLELNFCLRRLVFTLHNNIRNSKRNSIHYRTNSAGQWISEFNSSTIYDIVNN